MQEIKEKISNADAKQQAILASAFEAFRLYGFKRTSMEDIAKGAGMSRAALYLRYRNKEDIFQSLAQGYYDMAVDAVSQVLTHELPLHDVLNQAFQAQAGPIYEALVSSPHGQELLDTKQTNTMDVVSDGDARLVALYADWLRDGAACGRISLEGLGDAPEDVAKTIYDALHGVKTSLLEPEAFRASIHRLAVLFGRALAP
ncbi:MAG: TetR/AcrR family transcriptional regulator [Thalassovita sp.]